VSTVSVFAILGVLIYAFIQFFQAEEVKDWILYGIIILMSHTSIAMLKIWNWMQMDKNAILRETKRLELQVAMLVEKQRAS